jgi:hypothetical protein
VNRQQHTEGGVRKEQKRDQRLDPDKSSLDHMRCCPVQAACICLHDTDGHSTHNSGQAVTVGRNVSWSASSDPPDGVLVCCSEQGSQGFECLPGLLPAGLQLSLEQQCSWTVRLTGQQATHLRAGHDVQHTCFMHALTYNQTRPKPLQQTPPLPEHRCSDGMICQGYSRKGERERRVRLQGPRPACS